MAFARATLVALKAARASSVQVSCSVLVVAESSACNGWQKSVVEVYQSHKLVAYDLRTVGGKL